MSNDAGVPQEGLGLYRGPGEDWQPDQPGERAPEASLGATDPLAREWVKLADSLVQLGREIASAQGMDGPTGVASGNTDANGDLWLPIYQVAQGLTFRAHRLALEAAGYSPASPYSNASAWLAWYEADDSSLPGGSYTNLGDRLQGQAKDFGPGGGAGAQLMPAVFTDNSMQSIEIRGGRYLILAVVSGPASTRITVNYQGSLSRTDRYS